MIEGVERKVDHGPVTARIEYSIVVTGLDIRELFGIGEFRLYGLVVEPLNRFFVLSERLRVVRTAVSSTIHEESRHLFAILVKRRVGTLWRYEFNVEVGCKNVVGVSSFGKEVTGLSSLQGFVCRGENKKDGRHRIF